MAKTGTDKPLFGVRHYNYMADMVRSTMGEGREGEAYVSRSIELLVTSFERDNPSFRADKFRSRCREGPNKNGKRVG